MSCAAAWEVWRGGGGEQEEAGRRGRARPGRGRLPAPFGRPSWSSSRRSRAKRRSSRASWASGCSTGNGCSMRSPPRSATWRATVARNCSLVPGPPGAAAHRRPRRRHVRPDPGPALDRAQIDDRRKRRRRSSASPPMSISMPPIRIWKPSTTACSACAGWPGGKHDGRRAGGTAATCWREFGWPGWSTTGAVLARLAARAGEAARRLCEGGRGAVRRPAARRASELDAAVMRGAEAA